MPLALPLMARQIFTKKDAIRHAAGRIAIAVPLTVAISWTIASIQLGTNPDATVRVGYVTVSVIIIGAVVAALLTGGLVPGAGFQLRAWLCDALGHGIGSFLDADFPPANSIHPPLGRTD